MRKIIPQRKIKHRLHLLLTLLGIFCVTLVFCIAYALYSGVFAHHIISPLSKLVTEIHANNTIETVKQLCKKENMTCVSVVSQQDGSIEITLDTGTLVFLSTKKSIAEQLASLQKVASQLTIKGEKLKRVDFRFDHIVVSF